ncbi:hypothetical protein BGW39_008000 [Mortierella sp. 14UC]|nr:hypothetical protein BGW39_008000 [Mortierella sp. 14UC]
MTDPGITTKAKSSSQSISFSTLQEKSLPLVPPSKARQVITDIFSKNLPKPIIKTELPRFQQRIVRTDQLVYCNNLLIQDSMSQETAQVIFDKAEVAWLREMKSNPMEEEHLHWLATRMVEEFIADAVKDSAETAEIIALGPVLPKEPFRKLLSSLIKDFDEARILDVKTLQGLVQLFQEASPDFLDADDLVKILSILRIRLAGTDQQLTKHCYHLSQAVAKILDVMAEHRVQNLDRVLEHEPLSGVLSGLTGSSDPYLMYQACYAFQALQYVPDDENALQTVLRHSAGVASSLVKVSSVTKLDLASVLEGLGRLKESIGGMVAVAGTVYGGVSSLIESGQGTLDGLKEGLSTGKKRPWYAAVKAAHAFTQAGQLEDLKKLVLEVPCRREPLFQWGISQLLGEIAVDSVWTVATRQQAISFLGYLYKGDQDWGRDESVKTWMLVIITKLSAISDPAINAAALALLQDLDQKHTTAVRHLYPLRTRLPTPTLSPLLAKVQHIPYLEYDLHRLRLQRLEETQMKVYIPPMAKANLQARDEDLFLLMDKVEEFLDSDRQVMLVLGDSGSGKSTFNTHLESKLLKSYKSGGCIPLFINLPAIDEPQQDMIEKQLKAHNFSNEQVKELKLHRQLILICDGYDESQQLVNLHRTNFLNQSGQWNTKMIITCRTQYLGQDYRSRFMPTVGNHFARPVSELFQEAVIAPFSKEQIESYVDQYVPLEPRTLTTQDYMDKLTAIPNLMDLVKNPFVLTLALEALPLVTKGKQDLSAIRITRVQLYDTFVHHWIDVNKRRLEGMALSDDDRGILDQLLDADFILMGTDYSVKLASAIFHNQDGNPVVQYTHLSDKNTWRAEFFSQDPEVRLLRDSIPLSRTGRLFRFVHRSVQEYFFSRAVFDPINTHSNRHDFAAQSASGFFAPRPLDTNSPLFKRSLLKETSVIQFLGERAKQHPEFERQLRDVIEQSKITATVVIAATNAITILVQSGVRFNGADLRGIRVPGADLSDGQFDFAKLQGADLKNVNLARCWLRRAHLSNAQMEGVHFDELPFLKEDRMVCACACSSDGKHLAAGLANGSISIYDTTTWERLYRHTDPGAAIVSIAISPNNQQIAFSSSENRVRLCDIITGEVLRVLEGHTDGVRSVAFSPCGRRITSGSSDTTVRVWDTEAGENVLVLRGHEKSVMNVKYSPDGRQLASSSLDGTIRLWDAETGQSDSVWEPSHGAVWCLAYSPDGQQIIAGHVSGQLQLWNTVSGERGPMLNGHTGAITAVAFSPNGQWAASSSQDATVRLWDVSGGALVSTLTGHGAPVQTCTFSQDSKTVFSGGRDCNVRLWEVVLRGPNILPYKIAGITKSVHYSPDGRSIFSSSTLGAFQQWDSSTGARGFSIVEDCNGLYSGALCPDGRLFATCGRGPSSEIRLLSCRTGEIERILAGHSKATIGLDFSPCGRWLLSANHDKSVRIWDLQAIEPPHVLVELDDASKDCVIFAAFSPSGDQIATGTRSCRVFLYDARTRSALKEIALGEGAITALTYAPNGQQIAVSTSKSGIFLWDLQSDTERAKLDGHDSFANCLAFSPCGQWLLSGGQDRTVRIWKRKSAQSSAVDVGVGRVEEHWSCVYVIGGFLGIVVDVAWNPMEPLEFVTGGGDRSIRAWKMNIDNENNSVEEGVSVCMRWGTDFGQLVAHDA